MRLCSRIRVKLNRLKTQTQLTELRVWIGTIIASFGIISTIAVMAAIWVPLLSLSMWQLYVACTLRTAPVLMKRGWLGVTILALGVIGFVHLRVVVAIVSPIAFLGGLNAIVMLHSSGHFYSLSRYRDTKRREDLAAEGPI